MSDGKIYMPRLKKYKVCCINKTGDCDTYEYTSWDNVHVNSIKTNISCKYKSAISLEKSKVDRGNTQSEVLSNSK